MYKCGWIFFTVIYYLYSSPYIHEVFFKMYPMKEQAGIILSISHMSEVRLRLSDYLKITKFR